MSRSKFPAIIACVALFNQAPVLAAEASASGSSLQNSAAPTREIGPTLRIQLVITRFQGEKKLGSLPYTFVVAPNNPTANMMRIRLGVDVPVPQPAGPPQYRNIGTDIDCFNVRELSGGRYQFDINLQTSAAIPATDGSPANAAPLVRKFDSNFTSVLRDGQTAQAIASTDPVTGEVVKIDVTLNVVR
jgi:hypothetical protein